MANKMFQDRKKYCPNFLLIENVSLTLTEGFTNKLLSLHRNSYYNPGHNILELYSVLVQVRFTTSKTKLDVFYSKLGIRVASRAAKRLKT